MPVSAIVGSQVVDSSVGSFVVSKADGVSVGSAVTSLVGATVRILPFAVGPGVGESVEPIFSPSVGPDEDGKVGEAVGAAVDSDAGVGAFVLLFFSLFLSPLFPLSF